MEQPVDLANLRDIIDGNQALEQELLQEFLTAFDAEIKSLHSSMGQNATVIWRTSAHAMRGLALNLGAMMLSERCAKAQEDHLASEDVKRAMLQHIATEYEHVRRFVLQVLAG